jgi:hypothetical protein
MVEIYLGATYRDVVTGVVGVAVSETRYLGGCRRVALQQSVGADGKIPAEHHVESKLLRYDAGPSAALTEALL